jgi:hypothetical protein
LYILVYIGLAKEFVPLTYGVHLVDVKKMLGTPYNRMDGWINK